MDNYSTLVEAITSSGWEIIEGNSNELADVDPSGVVHCVDGRKREGQSSPDHKLRGPKIQGGVLGVMSLILKRGDEEGVRQACTLLKSKGYIPSVHGDDHKQEAGCGFAGLWTRGELPGFPALEVALERIKEIVLEEGGEYIPLTGAHAESKVRLNLIKGKTVEPDEDSFNLDLWLVEELGGDPMEVATNALAVVGLLKPDVQTVELYR